MFNPVSKKILSTAFLLLVIVSNSTGAFAYNAFANLLPVDTPLPDGHWIIIQDNPPSVSDGCVEGNLSWLYVIQRSAVISLMMLSQFSDTKSYKIAVPYNEPVWVDGIFNTKWGTGCVVYPGQTLTFSYVSGGTPSPDYGPPVGPGSSSWYCLMSCP